MGRITEILQQVAEILGSNGYSRQSDILLQEPTPMCDYTAQVLTTEEYNLLVAFTAIGSGTLYSIAQNLRMPIPFVNMFSEFDNVLRKLGYVSQDIVYRMDTYDKDMPNETYGEKFIRLKHRNIALRIPWSLSASIENWNDCGFDTPVWEIHLLPQQSMCHPICPFLCGDSAADTEKEVRFESGAIFHIVDIREECNRPLVVLEEISSLLFHGTVITIDHIGSIRDDT